MSHAIEPKAAGMGLALLCRRDGRIDRIIRDSSDLSARVGSRLTDLLDRDSHAKADRFLETAWTQRAAFDWELVVREGEQLKPLSFLACRLADDRLVIAAGRPSAGEALWSEMLRMHNDQTNALRDATKRLTGGSADAATGRDEAGDTPESYEQLTRVNSDLVNMQRELSQKNALLSRMNRQLIAVQTELTRRDRQLEEVNGRLREQAQRDPLTGLMNRGVFDEEIARQTERAARTGAPLSLLLIDIDHFKQLNDREGHTRGDQVLRQVADRLERPVGPSQTLARYGGEEFALIAPDTDEAAALELAERLRLAVGDECIADLAVTVSVGAATGRGETAQRQALVDRADQALYHSKEHGRNRTTHARDMPADDEASSPSSPACRESI